jgi:hypothetical protein
MKAGVLIIGSLYWDKHEGEHLNVRKKWRDERLEMDGRIHVLCPIRYGRKSGKGVFTMVFSKSIEQTKQWGTAFAVPCQAPIDEFKDLLIEAEWMSYAEGANDRKLVKGIENKWCVIGILFNPSFDANEKKKLLDEYQSILEKQGLGKVHEKFCIAPELSILSPQGEILIEWPKAVDPEKQAALDQHDFIIATSPRQNQPAYPDAKYIKAEVRNDARKYFYNNVASGITTYQDREIVEA